MIYKFENNSTNLVPNPTIPEIFKVRGKKWISWGDNNLWPSYVTELYNKCSINRRCLQSKMLGVAGEGLRTIDPNMEYILGRANDNESFNDVWEKVVTDYELYGSFALNIIWTVDGSKIHSFYHVPLESVRSGEIDPRTDKVEKYYVSSSWKNFQKYTPIEYQAFDPNQAIEFPSQIMWFMDYNPSSLYYSLPTYAGALSDITVAIEVVNFQLSNLSNGLSPSLVINFKEGIPAPQQQQAVYEQMASAFSGTQNAGRYLMTFSNSPETVPDVLPLESANDEYYLALNSTTQGNILTAHGITSPLLLGVHETSTGFSSNKDEIMVSYELFKNTVLKPDIKALIKQMDRVVKFMGYPDTKLYVEPLKIFDKEAVNIATT